VASPASKNDHSLTYNVNNLAVLSLLNEWTPGVTSLPRINQINPGSHKVSLAAARVIDFAHLDALVGAGRQS
jgi:hypothetical protein